MAIGKLEEISILDEDANDTVHGGLELVLRTAKPLKAVEQEDHTRGFGSAALKLCDNLGDECMGIVAETINLGTQRIAHFEPEGLAMHEIEFQVRDP